MIYHNGRPHSSRCDVMNKGHSHFQHPNRPTRSLAVSPLLWKALLPTKETGGAVFQAEQEKAMT